MFHWLSAIPDVLTRHIIIDCFLKQLVLIFCSNFEFSLSSSVYLLITNYCLKGVLRLVYIYPISSLQLSLICLQLNLFWSAFIAYHCIWNCQSHWNSSQNMQGCKLVVWDIINIYANISDRLSCWYCKSFTNNINQRVFTFHLINNNFTVCSSMSSVMLNHLLPDHILLLWYAWFKAVLYL